MSCIVIACFKQILVIYEFYKSLSLPYLTCFIDVVLSIFIIDSLYMKGFGQLTCRIPQIPVKFSGQKSS